MQPTNAGAPSPVLLYRAAENDRATAKGAACEEAVCEEDMPSVSQSCEEDIRSMLSQSGDEECVQVAFEWSEVVAAARGLSSRKVR